MRVRLVAVCVHDDISYDVQVFDDKELKWRTVRCFDAREREMAMNYVRDMRLIKSNKYDACMKFPNTIIEVE